MIESVTKKMSRTVGRMTAVIILCGISAAHAQTTAPAKKAVPTAPAATAPAAAPASAKAVVDLSKSSVTATFKQSGVSTEGVFQKFSIAVDFDLAKIADTKAQIDVDMKSYDVGDESYNEEILKKDWFNAPQYPKASFTSTAVKVTGPGKLDVMGKLSIKGKTIDVTVPVTYKQDGNKTLFEGMLPIKRLGFAIGEGVWKDTSVVEDDVRIKFKIALQAK